MTNAKLSSRAGETLIFVMIECVKKNDVLLADFSKIAKTHGFSYILAGQCRSKCHWKPSKEPLRLAFETQGPRTPDSDPQNGSWRVERD